MEAQAKMTVQAVLQQRGCAYHYITQKRRRSVVLLVDPTFDFLLSTLSAFSPGKEAVKLLFMEKFLEVMLKEATQDATLANSAAAREKAQVGKRKEVGHPGQSNRVVWPRRVDDPQTYPGGGQNGASGKGRTTATKSWLSGGDKYVNKSVINSETFQVKKCKPCCGHDSDLVFSMTIL